ncbi:MAG: hypothetical protein HY329_27465 [Chloroflexi bacterium]|nr:hypothetical protein [Chloroflexota bacterium]
MSNRPLGQHHSALAQFLVNLGNAALAAIAPRSDERDDLQPELAVGQRESALRFRPLGLPVPDTRGGATAPDDQRELPDLVQQRQAALTLIGDPQRAAAAPAVAPVRLQAACGGRVRASASARHLAPPAHEGLTIEERLAYRPRSALVKPSLPS